MPGERQPFHAPDSEGARAALALYDAAAAEIRANNDPAILEADPDAFERWTLATAVIGLFSARMARSITPTERLVPQTVEDLSAALGIVIGHLCPGYAPADLKTVERICSRRFSRELRHTSREAGAPDA